MPMSGLYYACLALLEDETAELYERLAERCSDGRVKLLLLNVLHETKKHGEIFKFICASRGATYPPRLGECEKEAGSLLVGSLRLTRSLKERAERGEPLAATLERLIGFEGDVGEEYLARLHAGASGLVEDDRAAREVLAYVAEDEERHVNLLKLACALLSKGRRERGGLERVKAPEPRRGSSGRAGPRPRG